MAASGVTLVYMQPGQANIPKGYGARFEKHGTKSALRFPQGQDSYVEFDFVLPRTSVTGFTGTTGIKAALAWQAATGQVAGNCYWGVEIHPVSQTDLTDATDDTVFVPASYEDTATTAVNATASKMAYSTISHTVAHIKGAGTTAAAVGDLVRCRITRKGSSATDTLVDDVYLHAVEFYDY